MKQLDKYDDILGASPNEQAEATYLVSEDI